MKLEIMLPGGQRISYHPRSSVSAGTLATNLAKKHGLWRKGQEWQLVGPIGPIDPRHEVRYVELYTGEGLILEKAKMKATHRKTGAQHGQHQP